MFNIRSEQMGVRSQGAQTLEPVVGEQCELGAETSVSKMDLFITAKISEAIHFAEKYMSTFLWPCMRECFTLFKRFVIGIILLCLRKIYINFYTFNAIMLLK